MRQTYRLLLIALVACMTLLRSSVAEAQATPYHEVLVLRGAGDGRGLRSAIFGPDGKKVAAWDYNVISLELFVWDSINGELTRRFKVDFDQNDARGYPRSLSWSPDSRYLAGVVFDTQYTGALYVWDMNTGQRTTIANRTSSDTTFEHPNGKVAILEARWNPKNMSIVLIEIDGTIRLIDFPSGRTRWEFPSYSSTDSYYCNEFRCRLAWNPEGTRFVSRNGIGAVFDGTTGRQVVKLTDPTYGASHAKWTPDGKYVFDDVFDGANDRLYVWNATTGNLVDIPIKKVEQGAFDLNPDGERIAYVANYQGTEIAIANWHTGTILTVLALPVRTDLDVVWSPDGKHLAVAENGVIHIYGEAAKESGLDSSRTCSTRC